MRLLFQYASDRYGDFYPARLLPEALWAGLWLAAAFCALHALRRWRGAPPTLRLARYQLNQRLYHWANFLLLAALAVSGFFLFSPGAPRIAAGFTVLDVHLWAGLLFAIAVLFHAVAATTRGDAASMRPRIADVHELRLTARSFFGRRSEVFQPGKYDALQKLFHTLLALLAIIFVSTGVLMWLALSRRMTVSRTLLHWLRLGHDLAALALAVMVIGHIYFSFLKSNRENLRDMVGLRRDELARAAKSDG